MGRQALPRAERRGARRRDRGLGGEALLRLGAADLDDPLPGRPGPVEPPGWSFLRPGRTAARPRARRGRHPRIERPRRAPRAARRPRRRDRRSDVGRIPGGAGCENQRASSWIRAVEWVPYQLPTFVSPAFAGYVSGHSTFSRAAAEVLTAFTGSSYFPGGIHEVPVPTGSLRVEQGPSEDLTMSWATYFDAADDAGRSTALHGHPRPSRRPRGPAGGSALREGCVGARTALLRGLRLTEGRQG